MGGLLGGSKSTQTSKSWNDAYPFIRDTFSGTAGRTGQATDMISNLLGLGDSEAGAAAFNSYKNSAGYQEALKAGTDAITGNAAAGGLLQSGSTLKGLSRFGQDLASQYYNNHIDKLMGLSGQGLQAGGLITQAGQRNDSTSKSKSKPGLGGLIGGLAGGLPLG